MEQYWGPDWRSLVSRMSSALHDPQDASRLENLDELVTVAREFAGDAAVADLAVEEAVENAGLAPADDATGEPEPGSLAAFLERVALLADADSIPDNDEGMVTLMTPPPGPVPGRVHPRHRAARGLHVRGRDRGERRPRVAGRPAAVVGGGRAVDAGDHRRDPQPGEPTGAVPRTRAAAADLADGPPGPPDPRPVRAPHAGTRSGRRRPRP